MNRAERTRGRGIALLQAHGCAAALLALIFLTGCAMIWTSLKNKSESTTAEIETNVDHFERSKALLAEGNYDAAYRENQKIVSERKGAADVALYNMGTISAHPLNPKKNYPSALASFRTVVANYPESPLTEQARIWIQVLEEQQLVLEHKQKVLEERQKLLEEKRAVIREKEKLSEERERLAQEREKIKYAAEKSRQLDLEIEKRRRQTLAK